MSTTTKPDEAAIAAKLLTWGKLQMKRLEIESQKNMDLEPFVLAFHEATREITESADLALAMLAQKQEPLAAEITADFLAGCNAETGAIALPQVQVKAGKGVIALAIVMSKPGNRVVDAIKFFAFTPPKKRLAAFWSCVTIPVAKAESFVGKLRLATMATKATKHTVELKLTT